MRCDVICGETFTTMLRRRSNRERYVGSSNTKPGDQERRRSRGDRDRYCRSESCQRLNHVLHTYEGAVQPGFPPVISHSLQGVMILRSLGSCFPFFCPSLSLPVCSQELCSACPSRYLCSLNRAEIGEAPIPPPLAYGNPFQGPASRTASWPFLV